MRTRHARAPSYTRYFKLCHQTQSLHEQRLA